MNKVKNSNHQDALDIESQIAENDELDMETTFADMTVEGMPWHKPEKRGGGQNSEIPTLSKDEKRAMVRGMLLALLPLMIGLLLVMALLFGLAYVWLS